MRNPVAEADVTYSPAERHTGDLPEVAVRRANIRTVLYASLSGKAWEPSTASATLPDKTEWPGGITAPGSVSAS